MCILLHFYNEFKIKSYSDIKARKLIIRVFKSNNDIDIEVDANDLVLPFNLNFKVFIGNKYFKKDEVI